MDIITIGVVLLVFFIGLCSNYKNISNFFSNTSYFFYINTPKHRWFMFAFFFSGIFTLLLGIILYNGVESKNLESLALVFLALTTGFCVSGTFHIITTVQEQIAQNERVLLVIKECFFRVMDYMIKSRVYASLHPCIAQSEKNLIKDPKCQRTSCKNHLNGICFLRVSIVSINDCLRNHINRTLSITTIVHTPIHIAVSKNLDLIETFTKLPEFKEQLCLDYSDEMKDMYHDLISAHSNDSEFIEDLQQFLLRTFTDDYIRKEINNAIKKHYDPSTGTAKIDTERLLVEIKQLISFDKKQ